MSQQPSPLWAVFIASFVKSHGPPKEFTWATFGLETATLSCQVNKEGSQAHINHRGLEQKPWWPQRGKEAIKADI
jgi:hypothetical protein